MHILAVFTLILLHTQLLLITSDALLNLLLHLNHLLLLVAAAVSPTQNAVSQLQFRRSHLELVLPLTLRLRLRLGVQDRVLELLLGNKLSLGADDGPGASKLLLLAYLLLLRGLLLHPSTSVDGIH